METIENNNHQKSSEDELKEIRKEGLSYFLKAGNTSNSRAFILRNDEKDDESDEINQIGCTFFLNADPNELIYISSYELRWLTHKCKNLIKDEVRLAAREQFKRADTDSDSSRFNLKILLYSDPTKLKKEEKENIIKLLQCHGVHIRYKKPKEEQLLRISIRKNYLFLSLSGAQSEKVNFGILYKAEEGKSILINYFKEKFIQDFDRAKKIILKDGKITFEEDSLKTRIRSFWNSHNVFTGITGWIFGFLGICVGIVGIYLAWRWKK